MTIPRNSIIQHTLLLPNASIRNTGSLYVTTVSFIPSNSLLLKSTPPAYYPESSHRPGDFPLCSTVRTSREWLLGRAIIRTLSLEKENKLDSHEQYFKKGEHRSDLIAEMVSQGVQGAGFGIGGLRWATRRELAAWIQKRREG